MRTIGVITVFFKKMLAKLKSFSIENWGFPFISLFLIFLFVSAVLVATGSADLISLADKTAISAYFSLLVGVILQIICFSKKRKPAEASLNTKALISN